MSGAGGVHVEVVLAAGYMLLLLAATLGLLLWAGRLHPAPPVPPPAGYRYRARGDYCLD